MDFISIEAIKYGKNGFMKESLAYLNYFGINFEENHGMILEQGGKEICKNIQIFNMAFFVL